MSNSHNALNVFYDGVLDIPRTISVRDFERIGSYGLDIRKEDNFSGMMDPRVVIMQYDTLSHYTRVFRREMLRPDDVPRDRNRYYNVLPQRQGRVVLRQQGNDKDSDYISAGYVGYEAPGTLPAGTIIAASAPPVDYVADWWRMIWEQDVKLVVMVTTVEERGKPKSPKYWPDARKSEIHQMRGWTDPPIMVTGLESKYEEEGGYHHRTFRMSRMMKGEDEGKKEVTKIVHQLHYVLWKDFRVPEYFDMFFRHYRELRAKLITPKHKNYARTAPTAAALRDLLTKNPDTPIGKYRRSLLNGSSRFKGIDELSAAVEGRVIVHCSAGVGRTGAFLMCDMLVDYLAALEAVCVDVYKEDVSKFWGRYISRLRTERKLKSFAVSLDGLDYIKDYEKMAKGEGKREHVKRTSTLDQRELTEEELADRRLAALKSGNFDNVTEDGEFSPDDAQLYKAYEDSVEHYPFDDQTLTLEFRPISIFHMLRELRRSRSLLVFTPEQYAYIYEFVLDHCLVDPKLLSFSDTDQEKKL